jgi:hypothetical protein
MIPVGSLDIALLSERLVKDFAYKKCMREPADVEEVFPELIGLPRYAAEGPGLLFADLMSLIEQLPHPECGYAELLLGFKHGHKSLSARRAEKADQGGEGRKYHDRYIALLLLHQLIALGLTTLDESSMLSRV